MRMLHSHWSLGRGNETNPGRPSQYWNWILHWIGNGWLGNSWALFGSHVLSTSLGRQHRPHRHRKPFRLLKRQGPPSVSFEVLGEPRGAVEPGGLGAAGDEGGFEGAMEALDHAVGFEVVGCHVVIC